MPVTSASLMTNRPVSRGGNDVSPPPSSRPDPAGTAARIHADLPVVDGHNDLPWAIRKHAGGDLDVADPTGMLDGYQTDVPRLLAGGVGAQLWSVFVPAWHPDPLATTLGQIDLVERMVARSPERLQRADGADDIRRIRAGGRIACLLGAEGGHCIEGSLDALRLLRRRGVRYLTLTHADTTDWADSATDHPRHGGLSRFGRGVVVEMNRIGMLVDVSHVAVTTMRAAIETSTAPVIASHSGARAVAAHPRNIPDDLLVAIGATGGMVMVPFYPPFIVPATARRAVGAVGESRRLMAEVGDERRVDALLAERRIGWDRGEVGDVVDHIEHIAAVAGVDHVGLGSDFDGIDMVVTGLEDVSRFPAVTEELWRRGWSETHIRRVLGDNALRVLSATEG